MIQALFILGAKMYPTNEQLEHRRLELTKMENALLESKLELNNKLSDIEIELEVIDKLIQLGA